MAGWKYMYMNSEEVKKGDNIKEVLWKALEEGLSIIIGDEYIRGSRWL